METLKQHLSQIEKTKYNGVVTEFSGYLQFGQIKDSGHALVGFTADSIRKATEIITNPNYAYARQAKGYIKIYGRDENSPTGVSLLGGIPDELEFLLSAFGRTGQLSPTEDLRTAH